MVKEMFRWIAEMKRKEKKRKENYLLIGEAKN